MDYSHGFFNKKQIFKKTMSDSGNVTRLMKSEQ